ncbi:hypothetical protein RHSIM_Rhsim01G0133500 [Rhododendron simsii]|uniref:HAT C-terminal dimerisation domain-containing protein n=1 Tax=Rhododendron simsii TaxID=118357 RepID=A0A834HGY8_RHOSS|nr:hypothetical protein RHSIM_Rhsim01G0133500 [Rhododendron simsii]
MKNHLAGTHNEACEYPQVPEEVKDFFLKYLKEKNQKKATNFECFDEDEDVGVNSKSMGTMDAYVTKGKKKEKQLTLNEMVKKREPVIKDIFFKDTLVKEKDVIVFIYRHQWVLDMFRKYTLKKELARPAITRFATSYLTLKRFDDLKIQIRAMLASVEWATSSYGNSAAGKGFNSETFKADREVRKGLYTTIERMYPDMNTRITIDEQLEKFKNAEGMLGMDMAKLTRDKKLPAIRVLSGTCSATGCERNWSTFDIVHSKRRNHLETQRMNALVFVKYNIQLELRQERGDTYDPICLSDMESDDEWITEKEGPVLPVDHSWMDIEECFKDDGTAEKLECLWPKKGKKKASELDDEDEIEVLDDNEVIKLEGEEEEEEFDEVTMADDDDDVEELDLEDD